MSDDTITFNGVDYRLVGFLNDAGELVEDGAEAVLVVCQKPENEPPQGEEQVYEYIEVAKGSIRMSLPN